ncbi:MAG: transposase [Candidatus Eisenbacteria bacterium]|nr:transposase [Candidatus Eisenbacteria bacterium]
MAGTATDAVGRRRRDVPELSISPENSMTPKHFTEERHYHYLTFSCLKHAPLFQDESLYSLFIKCLKQAKSRGLFKLSGFVIMPNHAHLLILPEDNISVSAILRAIKQPFSHRALN